LLGCVLQSLKEVDRYRDATLRKAVLNGILAAFVERTQDKPASGGLGLGSIQRSTEQGSLSSSGNTVSGDAPLYQAKEFLPGLTLTNLQVGETIKAHGSTGTDEKFGEFEAAILSSVAWSLGVPPEVMRMSFGSNYSASKAAIQEFGFILEILRMGTGEGFCQPVYREFVISLALLRRVAMPGFLEAWRDRGRWETTAAWLCTAWSGQVKPSLDLGKSIGAYGDAIDRGFITHEQATKELFGGRWDRNVDKLKRELVRIRDAVGDGEDLA
jgi:capsid protein